MMRRIACIALLAAALPTRAMAADDDHLRRGLAFFDAGNYAAAKFEFESMLRLDGLPANLYQQVELYAAAARDQLAGQAVQAGGYLVLGGGHYRETDSIAGAGSVSDNFFSTRVGGRVTSRVAAAASINASVDYRFRRYDNADRDDDSDLFWDLDVSRSMGANNLAVGTRGWISARGDGITRHEYGVFTSYRISAGPDTQFSIGADLRRRDYPQGRLRYRSRNIVELTGGWQQALFGGAANIGIDGGIGREIAVADRPDGDSNVFTVAPTLDFTFSKSVGGHVFGWWQRGRFNLERTNAIDGDRIGAAALRTDTLWEAGGGLSWAFAKGWSANADILYIRDESNIISLNYRATETHLTLRKDF
jgi:hypothetical protein